MDNNLIMKKKKRVNIKSTKKESLLKIQNIVFIFFMILFLIIVLHYEPWRDEAQSYLLSKLNLLDLFNQLKVEGHPIIWYLIMKIINLPYNCIWLLPWSITLISTALIVYKMDKPFVIKIIILLSFPIIYVSNVYARSYCLIVLLVILLAFVYQKRYEHPLIYGILLFLVMNTHVILIGFIGALVLIDVYNFIKNKSDRKSIAIILLIFIIGLVFLVLQLSGSASTRTDLFIENLLLKTNYLKKLNYMILNITNNNMSLLILFYFYLIYLIIYLIIQKEYKLLTVLIISTIGFVGIIAVYKGNNYMHVMYMMILLFIYWQIESKRRINIIIGILFACTFLNTIEGLSINFKGFYSPARITSKYIKNNIDKSEKIYCLNTAYCSALVPYNMDYHFIDIRNNERFTYVDWTKNIYKKEDIKEFELNEDQISTMKYIIIPKGYEDNYKREYEIIYKNTKCSYENFIILKRK